MGSGCGCVPAPVGPSWPRGAARGARACRAERSAVRVLPARLRMRSSVEFRATISTGRKIRRSTLMLYVAEPSSATDATIAAGPRVGLVVGRNVGNAVQRNRVKRRLRHGAARLIEEQPSDARIVIRAFPAAAGRPERLVEDLSSAWHAGLTDKNRIRP